MTDKVRLRGKEAAGFLSAVWDAARAMEKGTTRAKARRGVYCFVCGRRVRRTDSFVYDAEHHVTAHFDCFMARKEQ
mgnify:CR=1 FL=1